MTTMTSCAMQNTLSQGPATNQKDIDNKRVHKRLKFEIQSKEDQYKKMDTKKDQSQRLHFIPLDFDHQTTVQEEVSHIRQTLKASSKIAKSCKFQLWQNQDMNNKIFSQFGQDLKKAQGLRVINFNLCSTSEISDIAFKNISFGLKPLKQLQHLKITMKMCPNVNNEGFAEIGKALKRLPSLETLDLRFNDGGEATHIGLKIIWESLKALKALKALSLCFNSERKSTFVEFGHLNKEFKWLESLKVIKLRFETTSMKNFGRIKSISRMLKELTGLEEINLSFSLCGMGAQWLETLIEGFRGKSKLKRIELDIGGTDVTNQGLNSLKECFQELGEIKDIVINLEGCPYVKEEEKELFRKALQEISSLKHLEIIFK